MPLCTTATRPLQSVWGWALASVGLPWVAQRVCPRPRCPLDPRFLPGFVSSRTLPADLWTSSRPLGVRTAMPELS